MNKINSRQVCFIMFIYTLMSKILTYPTQVSNIAGHDLLISAFADFLIGVVVVWALAFLCSRTDKTFFGLLENTFGNIAARIIFGFFAAFFIAMTIIPILEQKVYVHNIFYDTVPSLLVFLPFFFFSVYAGSKGFRNIGRCADIAMPVALFAMLTLILMGFTGAKFDNLLPFFSMPVKKIFGGAYTSVHRFIEPCYLLMFMGNFEYRKGDAAKITISYAAGALLVMFVLAQYYAIYGVLASSRDFAISKIGLYAPIVETIGRIDLIALYILEVAMLFAVVLNIQLAVYCLKMCTGYNGVPVLSLAVNAVLLVLLFIFNNHYRAVSEIYARWAWIAVLIFAVIAPVASLALRRGEK